MLKVVRVSELKGDDDDREKQLCNLTLPSTSEREALGHQLSVLDSKATTATRCSQLHFFEPSLNR